LLTVQIINDGEAMEGHEGMVEVGDGFDTHKLRTTVGDLDGMVKL